MPGIKTLGKLFFKKNCKRKARFMCLRWRVPDRLLIARIIIRLKTRRSAEHLIPFNDSAAVTPRHELVLFTIRRHDCGAA